MKKLLDKNNPENTVVHVVMRGKDKKEYECVGVLMEETDDIIRVAFNAKTINKDEDEIIDDIKIKRSDIINIDIFDSSKIEKI
ncbi:MAG: hypothetical protein HYT28_02230 [Parcubacteria group bacterium]|nr:hypothetical protein [Parcubacteria group bacterium]